MMRMRFLLVILICLFASDRSWAYKESTHEDLSKEAVNASALKLKSSVLRDLGLDPFSSEQKFALNVGSPKTIVEHFRRGARLEDESGRSSHHFFNPLNGEALKIGAITAGQTSPDWALEDRAQIPGGISDGQSFSYRDGRLYFFQALTLPTKAEREKHFGLTFQTLGQVIHHIQDMAQPQHVRNDMHLELDSTTEQQFCTYALPICYAYRLLKNPSRYEQFTEARRLKDELRYGDYFPVYSDNHPHLLTSPRQFWHTESNKPADGKGLAEFTNHNFFSAATNNRNGHMFTSPRAERALEVDIQNLVPGTSLRGVVTFYSSTVKDNLVGQSVENPLATSVSIFDTDLEKAGKTRIGTLNNFNYAAQHSFLISRAVGYSAGLINYFFRGQIDMVKDTDQIDGYLIKNLGPEPMRGRFALYYDAKDDTRKPVKDTLGRALVWKTDDIQPEPLAPQGILRVTADFGTPADAAKPEEYILVFDGDMGEEKSSSTHFGAVTAKVIQAPNPKLYLAGFDNQGRRMTLKADGAGVRLVRGYDENNKFVDTGERPPIYDAFTAISEPVGRPQWNKQVIFEPGLRGTQYRVEAINGLGYQFSFDPKTQRWVTKAQNRVGWIARPANEPGIEYEFEIRDGGVALFYRRCSGYGSRSCGAFKYFEWTSDLVQGLQDNRLGGLPVSADGTQVCGLPATTGYRSNLNPPMPYSLYQDYSIVWSSQDQGQLVCLNFNFDKGVLAVSKSVLADFPGSSASGTATFYDAYPTNRSETAQGSVSNNGGAIIGYVEGKLHHLTRAYTGSFSSSIANYAWVAASQSTRTVWTFPEGNMSISGGCAILSSARFSTTAGPFGGSGPGEVGRSPAYALTHRANDAIYYVNNAACSADGGYVPPTLKFRDVVISDGAYVVDTSPNGEVFFARSDLSVIVHEPRTHGPKKIERSSLPTNLQRLVGALWL